MKKHTQVIAFTVLFLFVATIAFANWQKDLREGGVDTYLGYVQLKTKAMQSTAFVDYTTTSTARTVVARETGYTFQVSSSSDDPVTFNLPDAAAGLEYTFVDYDATAAADLIVNPQDGDKINGGTAGVSYNCTGDAVGETMTLRAINSTDWVIIGYRGTWATGS